MREKHDRHERCALKEEEKRNRTYNIPASRKKERENRREQERKG